MPRGKPAVDAIARLWSEPDLLSQELADADIPDTLEGVTSLVAGLFGTLRTSALVTVWNIGKVITKVQDAEFSHGDAAVETIAEQVGQSAKILWEMKRFYLRHPSFDTVSGMQLEWSAARELLRIDDGKVRQQLETKAVKERLTVRQVREMVNTVKKKLAPKPPKAERVAKGPNALKFFQSLDMELMDIIRTLDSRLVNLQDMLTLSANTERTTEEEFDLIVNGKDTTPALVETLSRNATSITEKLRLFVIPLRTVFDAETTETESGDLPKGASKAK